MSALPDNQHHEAPLMTWMSELFMNPRLTSKGRSLLELLRAQPELSAYASSRQLADTLGISAATVTRVAQSLEFSGWPEFQQEFRSRYVSSLSAVQVAAQHSVDGSSAMDSISRDRQSLEFLHTPRTVETVCSVAQKISNASRTLVVAQGSFAAPGNALSHNASIAGYEVQHAADPSAIANSLAGLGSDDLLIVFNSWQVYKSTKFALASATAKNLPTVLITDSRAPISTAKATHQIAVPSEGVGFFPSLVGAMSIVQAIVVELTNVNFPRTRDAIERAEKEWDKFDLITKRPR